MPLDKQIPTVDGAWWMKRFFFRFVVWRLGVIAQEWEREELCMKGTHPLGTFPLQVARQLKVPATQGVFMPVHSLYAAVLFALW